MNTKMRLDYIDIAKGLGMLAIVWGHICCKGWSNELVYTFHIPIFFVISGMMYNKEKYTSFKTFFVRRFKRLIIPYAIYSVLTWCMWAALCYFTHKPVESYWMPLLQTLIAKGSGGYLVHNVALWFVPCLFVVDCIYYFLSKFDDYVTLVLCFIGAGISMTLEYFYGKAYLELLPWNIDAGLMALPFYGIGNVFIHKVTHQRVVEFAQKNRSEVFGGSMVLTIALYFTAVKWGVISMGHSNFGNEYVFHFRGLLGSCSTILFSLWVASHMQMDKCKTVIGKILIGGGKYLRWFGKNSFDAMAINNPTKGVVCTIVAAVFHVKTADASFTTMDYSLLSFVITMIIVTIAMVVVQRLKQMTKK